ncbi:MAG TPA: DUF2280 domain-containing protein [Dongiaceae bacterium]|nr:DUF2280 domain-containing protein [Dongiaceae bacterium]
MQDSLCAGDSAEAPTLTQPLQDDESMPPITDEIKTFIVRGLASFDTPSEVVAAVKVNFGVEVSRQQVYAYDPRCAQPPAPRWRELHAATRAAFLGEIAEIGIAHKAFRLRALDRMVHYALKHHYPGRAQSLLEQAAKECAGVFEQGRGEQGRGEQGGRQDEAAAAGDEVPAQLAKPSRRGTRQLASRVELPESQ